jgi:hypothetical protein
MKGVDAVMATVLILIISITAIFLALQLGGSSTQRTKEVLLMQEGKNTLVAIDNAIKNVLTEGEGSVRVLRFSISGGNYKIYNSTNSVTFSMDSRAQIIAEGISKIEDGINFTGTAGIIYLNLSYDSIMVVGEGEFGRGYHTLTIRNNGYNVTTQKQMIYISLVPLAPPTIFTFTNRYNQSQTINITGSNTTSPNYLNVQDGYTYNIIESLESGGQFNYFQTSTENITGFNTTSADYTNSLDNANYNVTSKLTQIEQITQYNQTQSKNITGNASTINQAIIDTYLNINADEQTWDVTEREIVQVPPSTRKLYFNSTATGASCPTTSRKMFTTVSGSYVNTWPGEFDSGFPGNSDSGQWLPNSANRGNTTSAIEIANPSQTSRTSASFGQGWFYDEDLTGYTIDTGNFTFNLTLIGGQMAATAAAERIFARVSIVTCSGGNFIFVKDLLNTNCIGGTCSGGQAGWRANEGSRIDHPSVGAIVNRIVNITSAINHTFASGERLLIELGFGDASSTTDRTIGLRYNTVDSYAITPLIRKNTYELEVEHNTTVSYTGKLENISVQINFTSTKNDDFNFYIYNFTGNKWYNCNQQSVTANTYYNLWCNVSSSDYNSSTGTIRIKLNSTVDSDQTTLKEEYVQYYVNNIEATYANISVEHNSSSILEDPLSISMINVTTVLKTNISSGISFSLYIYNFNSLSWEQCSQKSINTSYEKMECNKTVNPSYYISDNKIRIRLNSSGGATNHQMMEDYSVYQITVPTEYRAEVEHNSTVSYSGTLNDISISLNLSTNSTNSPTFNFIIYNFVAGSWEACDVFNPPLANVWYMRWCNETINPSYFNSTTGVIRFRLNENSHQNLAEVKEDYIQYYVTYTT